MPKRSLESQIRDDRYSKWSEKDTRYRLTPKGHILNIATRGRFVRGVNAHTIWDLQQRVEDAARRAGKLV